MSDRRDAFLFVVPGAPVPWKRTKSVNGRRVTPKRAREYRQHIQRHASWKTPSALRGWPTDARYSVKISVYRNGVRYDLDNMQKMVGDALEGLLWENDSQIDRWESERLYDKDKPRLEVQVRVIG